MTEYEARLGYARYYAGVLTEVDRQFSQGGEPMLAALARYDLEQPQIEAAWRWLAERFRGCSDPEAALLCCAYAQSAAAVRTVRTAPRQWCEWIETGLDATRLIVDREAEMRLLRILGRAHAQLGEYEQALNVLEQARSLAQQLNDPAAESDAWNKLGGVYYHERRFELAAQAHEEALRLARQIGDRRAESNAVGNLGLDWAGLGDLRRSAEYHQRQITLAREMNDLLIESHGLCNLGLTYTQCGEPEQAIPLHLRSLDLTHALGNERALAPDYCYLAYAYAATGDLDAAADYFARSLHLARESGDLATEEAAQRGAQELLEQCRQLRNQREKRIRVVAEFAAS